LKGNFSKGEVNEVIVNVTRDDVFVMEVMLRLSVSVTPNDSDD
jgi:hypothetical protein